MYWWDKAVTESNTEGKGRGELVLFWNSPSTTNCRDRVRKPLNFIRNAYSPKYLNANGN